MDGQSFAPIGFHKTDMPLIGCSLLLKRHCTSRAKSTTSNLSQSSRSTSSFAALRYCVRYATSGIKKISIYQGMLVECVEHWYREKQKTLHFRFINVGDLIPITFLEDFPSFFSHTGYVWRYRYIPLYSEYCGSWRLSWFNMESKKYTYRYTGPVITDK